MHVMEMIQVKIKLFRFITTKKKSKSFTYKQATMFSMQSITKSLYCSWSGLARRGYVCLATITERSKKKH